MTLEEFQMFASAMTVLFAQGIDKTAQEMTDINFASEAARDTFIKAVIGHVEDAMNEGVMDAVKIEKEERAGIVLPG